MYSVKSDTGWAQLAAEAIRTMFRERGKPSVVIEPEWELDPDKGIVDVTLAIRGG